MLLTDKCFNPQTADSFRSILEVWWLNCSQSEYFDSQLNKRSCKKPPDKPMCPGPSLKTRQNRRFFRFLFSEVEVFSNVNFPQRYLSAGWECKRCKTWVFYNMAYGQCLQHQGRSLLTHVCLFTLLGVVFLSFPLVIKPHCTLVHSVSLYSVFSTKTTWVVCIESKAQQKQHEGTCHGYSTA